MQKQISDSVERAELLTDIMRGDITLKAPHPELSDVMIEQPPSLNARMKAADLLARMQGDYYVKTEISIDFDYAAELTRLKWLSNESGNEQDETINFM